MPRSIEYGLKFLTALTGIAVIIIPYWVFVVSRYVSAGGNRVRRPICYAGR
jgi:hypothetical protein